MLKRLWQLHSWIGLICGVGLLVIGLTGSLLVFHDEIEALVHPQMLQVRPSEGGRLPVDQLVAGMQRAFPDYEITYWMLRREPQWADVAYVIKHGEREARVASIDPYRAEIRAAPMDVNSTFTGWMLGLHYRFFAGIVGVAVTGLLAILLCFLGLSGFWLYRGFWKNLFRLRWRKSARIFFSDLHKPVGISSVILNLVLGVTGAYFNITEIANYIRSGGAPLPPRPVGRFYSETISFDRLLATAKEKLAGFEPNYIALPVSANGSIVFGGRLPTNNPLRSDYGSTVVFDANSGGFQQASDMRSAPILAQVVDTIVPLHFGTFGGLPIKVLWCFAGLTPGLLATSGTLIWWNRRRSRRSKSGEGRQTERDK